MTLCALAGGGLFSDHLGAQRAEAAAFRAEQENAKGQILSPTPVGTLRSLHNLIAYAVDPGGAERVCTLMSNGGQAAFAAVNGAADCPSAARTLGAKVTNRSRYAQFRSATQDQVIQGEHGTMDGCAVTWRDVFDPPNTPDPGPRLGRLTMARVAGQGFEITAVEPCPAQSGPTSNPAPSTRPPNTPATPAPTPPGLLPSYAPSLPGILAGRIATNDAATCGFFTDTGRREFAAAHKVADCPAAVARMHAQVSDPQLYADPRGATQAPGPAGRTVVDGCHLTWSRLSGPSRPGPQIGHLELEHPAGRVVGYLIAGYRPC